MKFIRLGLAMLFVVLCCCVAFRPAHAESDPPLTGDALTPPSPTRSTRAAGDAPDSYTPSAFLAGQVAVQVVFVESTGGHAPSTEDWTDEQRTTITAHVQEALDWWAARLPNAGISFDLHVANATTSYEPISLTLNEEKLWAGEALTSLGFAGSNYFEQAYNADENLRRTNHADWATTIFVVDSDNDSDGRFADGQFAYAYVGGPFLVITSDVSTYGTARMTPVIAHEFGHIFGALDQYEAANTPCTVQSGYLGVANTNSQYHGCGTKFASIMWEPLAAFQANAVDASALGQIGYRDSDNDEIPDPIDTTPTLDVSFSQTDGERPHVLARSVDQPFPSALQRSISINTISRIEFRADGGQWAVLPAADGAYNSVDERVDTLLPLYDGTHTIELRAINRVGAASPITTQQIHIQNVGAQPQVSIRMPAFVNSVSATIDIDAPAGFQVRAGENSTFGNTEWQPAQQHMSLTLAPSDGEHTVFVAVRDATGLEMPTTEHHLLLDRTAPVGSASVENHQDILVIHAEDAGSGIESMALTDANGNPGSWQPYNPTVSLDTNIVPTSLRLRDRAGNVSTPLTIQHPNAVYVPFAMR